MEEIKLTELYEGAIVRTKGHNYVIANVRCNEDGGSCCYDRVYTLVKLDSGSIKFISFLGVVSPTITYVGEARYLKEINLRRECGFIS